MSQYSSSHFISEDENSSWNKTFSLIKDGSLVLDIGCSIGTFGLELSKQKNCIVDGIEIDDNDFKEAQKRLRRVYKLNIETDELNIPTKYDTIFMGDVVEHLARPIETLKKLEKLLKAGGEIVFSIPNITHMFVRLMLMEGHIEYGQTGLLDQTHLHFYNREEVYRVFNEAGFKITHFDYTVNDLPEDLVKKALSRIGLVPNNKFKEVENSINAVAYQFIGVAKKSTNSIKQELPETSPENLVDKYINEIKADYDKIIKNLHKELHKTIEDRDRIQNELNTLRTSLKSAVGNTVKVAKKRLNK